MNAGAIKPRLRSDLIHRRIRMGKRWMWVVKDPISRSLFHFDDREHSLLCRADGTRTLRDLIESAKAIYQSQVVAPEPILAFIADANQKALLTSGFKNMASKAGSPAKTVNVLSVRFPGIDPTALLNRFAGPINAITSPTAVAVMVASWIGGSVIAITRWGDLMRDLATAASRIENAWILLVAIATMKIVHEVGHAIACRRFGARCSEIGVLVLFGIPCLYADVSDAWLIAKPWKRMLVSAAGMIAELTIAAIAAIVWTFTLDGTLRDLCVGVMVVGSVSTVLFNGNPLLRYDGYYILSDWVGVPNLAARSRAMLQSIFRSTENADTGVSIMTKTGLISYALASTAYRWFVLALIVSIIYTAAQSAGLTSLFLVIVGCFAAVRLARVATTSIQTQKPSRRFAWAKPAATFAGIVLLLLVPLPRRATGPAVIVAADSTDVIVTHGGTIQNVLLRSDDVIAGDAIVELDNASLEQSRLQLQTRLDRLTAILQSVRNRRGSDHAAADHIPTLTQAIEETHHQIQLIDDELDETIVRATTCGKWYPKRLAAEVNADDRQATFYSGNAIAPINRGAVLTPGTKLGVIGSPTAREATVYLDQSDITDIHVGDRVTLAMADRPRSTVTGRVIQTFGSPVDPPAPLSQAGLIRPTSIDGQVAPLYTVQIEIDPLPNPPPVQTLVTAQIQIEPISLWKRIHNFIGRSF